MTCGGKKKELGMLWLISADPIIVEVAPNEENVQLPTETTEEWEAAPGGVFAPVRPDTNTGGKGPRQPRQNRGLAGGETWVAKRRVAQRGWPSQWCFSA